MSKPFHESIVDSIQEVTRPRELHALASIIKVTDIPKNHEAIMNALTSKRDELVDAVEENLISSVSEAYNCLQKQQEEADGESE